jgi:CRISPR-associated endonuclease Cas3-HD
MDYFAHSENRGGRREFLHEHLAPVATKAAEFAEPFGADRQAYLAGLLHDLGKYSERFLGRLDGTERQGLDHWSLGAWACAALAKSRGLGAALAIEGHHIGLTQLPTASLEGSKRIAAAETFVAKIRNRIDEQPTAFTCLDYVEPLRLLGQECPQPQGLPDTARLSLTADRIAGDMLDVRMLFSALVDADFLETEAHFEGDAVVHRRPRAAGPLLTVEQAQGALQQRLAGVRAGSLAESLREVREQLLADCLAAADSPTGAFTLTAPTGAGKTLAMLAFALAHARKNGLRRIVLAMPFLNIVDQTAGQYEAMFSAAAGFAERYVLEQHSLVEDLLTEPSGDATRRGKQLRRQLAENWDAPIILTTTVQLLESLHAHKPSRCRKLHRLAGAVILLDEAQTLPPHLTPLTLATLSRLSDPQGLYRSSVVFATATQPAFAALGKRVASYYSSGWNPREIVRDPPVLFSAAKARTQIEWHDERPLTLDSLAQQVAHSPRCLCIVNLKRHAITLASQLQQTVPNGLFHLSTNMCQAHREVVLQAIRARLVDSTQPPTRVVATQCVEAGVDLDFRPFPADPTRPVLFRALAPLDSIAQAAGRANRNGLSERAKVVVVQIDDAGRATYPPGYGQGVQCTVSLLSSLREEGIDPNSIDLIHDPEWIGKYYRKLYDIVGRDDRPAGDEEKLHGALQRGDFEEVAKLYKLIDTTAINIIVPYNQQVFKELKRDLRRELDFAAGPRPGFLRSWKQRARKYSVAIRPPAENDPLRNFLEPISLVPADKEVQNPTWFWLLDFAAYDPVVGLVPPSETLLIV